MFFFLLNLFKTSPGPHLGGRKPQDVEKNTKKQTFFILLFEKKLQNQHSNQILFDRTKNFGKRLVIWLDK